MRKNTPMVPSDCAIKDKVQFLTQPASYPAIPIKVDVIETHMSWVFLAGDHVYKLKKPVVFPFLDFTKATARRTNCEAEVRLNRRLAPDIYLGIETLTREKDGSLRLGGAGVPVDWLVHMKRLPQDLMLDVMILEKRLAPYHLDALANTLDHFYRSANRPAIDPEAHLANLAQQQRWNRETLGNGAFPLDHTFVEQHLFDMDAARHQVASLIRDRIRRKCYVDGHGDLRPQHVCFSDPIAIFDCLEFDDRLRFVDPFDELAFLSLECDFLGAGWVEREILDRLRIRLSDEAPPLLIDFYTAFRATLRARMALSHLAGGAVPSSTQWVAKAERYLDLAHAALVRTRQDG
ncbi:hypothetical protein [Rhizobium daejeonense]|nr:hypothetical protein [Rhizobium daejeonense]